MLDPGRSPVVLVTGTSSGIGLALARQLWTSPYRAVVTARRQSLGRLAAESFRETHRFLIRPLDVTLDEERRTLIEEIEDRWGGVDVLINNAGISYRSVLEHMSEEDDRLQLATNFLGPMALCRLVLPGMRQRRRGHILNVSSVGGMMAMPTMGAYSASKFALEGASEALWYELRPWNIHVTLVQPGFVHSESFQHVTLSARARASLEQDDGYAAYYREMSRFVERLMGQALATPEQIASRILRLLNRRRPPLRVPVTIDASFFYLLRRLLPRAFYHWILYRSLPEIGSWGPHERP